MSSENLPDRARNSFLRVFAIPALGLAFAMLPGCGKNEADDNGKEIGAARIQIQHFEDALCHYNIDVGTYLSELQCLVDNLDGSEKWNGPYMKVIPKDPWGMEYQYAFPGEHNQPEEFDLWSFGPDGKEGGEGENADITNWEQS